MTSWNTVLDEIERDLVAMEAALADQAPIPDPSERSQPTGPLPAALEPRAEVLLARTRSLEARAALDRGRIGSSLLALAGRHQAPEPARTGRVVDVAG
jgi:hypothetical protein